MRTPGARDKHQRKRRSDKGKRRKVYRGKKTKPRKRVNGNLVAYVPKRKYGDPIKVAFWIIGKMSQEKYFHFDKKIRRYMKRTTYGKFPGRVYLTVDPMEINNKEKLGAFCQEILYPGRWLIMLPGHSKNRFHVSYKANGVAIIKDTSEGIKTRIIPSYKNRSLGRYWWWEKT